MMKKLLIFLILLGSILPGAVVAQEVTTLIASHAELKDYITVHSSGVLYVSNQQDKIIRVDPITRDVTTFGSGFTFITGLVFGPDNFLYASDSGTGEVLKIALDRTVETFASGLNPNGSIGPVGLVFDSDNNLYASGYNGTISKITPDGTVSIYAESDSLSSAAGLAIDEAGILYASSFASGNITSIMPDGTVNLLATVPGQTGYMAYAGGALYATGYDSHVVYKVTMDGQFSVFAGTGDPGDEDGSAQSSPLDTPNGIAANPDGTTLYITSDGQSGSIRSIEGIVPITSSEVPQKLMGYALSPNYPNPFHSSTSMSFTLPASDVVTITIYDVLGRFVERPVSSTFPVGTHVINFSMEAEVAPGIYFYTMRTKGGYAETRKMIRLSNPQD